MLQIILSITFLSIIGIIAFFIYFNHLVQRSFRVDHIANKQIPADFNIEYQNLLIETSGKKRNQVWDLNPGSDAPIIIFVHGWATSAAVLIPLAGSLVKNWRPVLLNVRNHGDSSDEKYTTILTFKDDIINTINYFEKNGSGQKHFILAGHSMGGAAVLAAAADDPRIKGVISISTFANLQDLVSLALKEKNVPGLFIKSIIHYIEFRIGEEFNNLSPVTTINQFHSPVLLVHGLNDLIVSIDNMEAIKDSANRAAVKTYICNEDDHSSILRNKNLSGVLDRFINGCLIQNGDEQV